MDVLAQIARAINRLAKAFEQPNRTPTTGRPASESRHSVADTRTDGNAIPAAESETGTPEGLATKSNGEGQMSS